MAPGGMGRVWPRVRNNSAWNPRGLRWYCSDLPVISSHPRRSFTLSTRKLSPRILFGSPNSLHCSSITLSARKLLPRIFFGSPNPSQHSSFATMIHFRFEPRLPSSFNHLNVQKMREIQLPMRRLWLSLRNNLGCQPLKALAILGSISATQLD